MLIFDTESDGLLDEATILHCLNLIDRTTGARERYNDQPDVSSTNRVGTIAEGVARLKAEVAAGGVIAGQNIIGHDIPIIQKFYPDFSVHPDQTVDTLVDSRLIWTDLKDIDQRAIKKGRRSPEFQKLGLPGRHSLEAWGHRLGHNKGDYATIRKAQAKELGLKGEEFDHFVWGTFTPDMDDYCAEDCEVTLKLVEKIEAEGYSEEARALERRVAEIIRLQERHGFYFYRDKAEELEIELTAEKARLEDELRSAFLPWFEPERKGGMPVVADPKRRRTAQAVAETGETWRSSYEPGERYTKVKLISFEPGSRDMIANRLINRYGWVPTEFTPTGKPEVNETTLGGMDFPEVKLLIRYLVIAKLLGTVATGKKAWLKSVREDGRIHSPVNSNGAVTGRMTHADHIAQVPRIKLDENDNVLLGYEGKYGYESRSLFGAPPGKLLVGVDAEGLELRLLAHYMARYDDGDYVDTVVNGDKKLGTDVHSVNRKVLGIRTRDGAKTWMYAYLYGAGNLKLGMTFYEDMSEAERDEFNRKHAAGGPREKALSQLGGRGRKRIETGLPALGKLQEAVREVARTTKQLRSLDGRLLNIRAQHSALNTLLQGGGAVVMKKALVLAYDGHLARGWQHGREFANVANIHDEFQMEVLPEHAEEVGQIAADAIRAAGEAFDLRCPLSGSTAVGQTWSSTH